MDQGRARWNAVHSDPLDEANISTYTVGVDLRYVRYISVHRVQEIRIYHVSSIMVLWHMDTGYDNCCFIRSIRVSDGARGMCSGSHLKIIM